MPKIIFLADPHPAIEAGIQLSLLQPKSLPESSVDLKLAGRVGDATHISDAVAQHQPDVLITETRIGGRDALKTLEGVIADHSNLKVIIYSAQEDATHIARAAAIGCYDYLPKTATCDRLMSVVRDAVNGIDTAANSLLKTTRTRIHRRKYADQVNGADIPLTNREFQVLCHISLGMSNREIGKSLKISVETVKEHVQNILKKLNVNDRTQAAVMAIRNGWS